MEQIIAAFGIDLRLIIIQVINFAILMAVLVYFLYRPILNMLKTREEKIAKGLEDARVAGEERAKASEEKQATLSAAHAEAEAIVGRAATAAKSEAAVIIGAAETKAGNVVTDAEAKREEIIRLARKESEKEIAEIAILAAEKVLRERA